MAGRPRKLISIPESEIHALMAKAMDPAESAAMATRIRIVLGSALGIPNGRIAEELGVSVRTVMKWRDRFVTLGEAGLHDAPRSGAPRRIDDKAVAGEIARGLSRGDSTRQIARIAGVSQSTVARIWRGSGLPSVRYRQTSGRAAEREPDFGQSPPRPSVGSGADDDLMLAFYMAPVGLMVSRQRVVHAYNQAFCDMFGYSETALAGRSLEVLYPSPKEFQHIGERALVVMRDTGVYSDERIMRRVDERLFWCHVSGRAIDRNDPFAAAVWTFEDLSSVRKVTADLTSRERQIAQLLVNGRSSKQIARELDISPRTVEAHRARLMRKYGVESGNELVAHLIGRTSA